jgi:hypothetical protein
VPTGLLPVWQEGVARTANQPGFYRCDGGVFPETAPTGLLPVWARGAGRLGSTFWTPRFDLLGEIDKREYTTELVNRVSTDMTAKVRGPRSRLGWSLFIDPLATPPTQSGGAWNEVLTGLLPE